MTGRQAKETQIVVAVFVLLCCSGVLGQARIYFPLFLSGQLSHPARGGLEEPNLQALYESSLAVSQQYSAPLYPIPSFIRSTSIDTNYLAQEAQLQQMNVTHCRVYCMWSYLTPSLDEPESFTVEELRQNTSWIEPYSATLNWDQTDYQVQQLVASGISPLIEIGEGTDHSLPTVSAAFNSSSGYADPGTVGEQQYLAYMYRYSRAVVHRYKQYVTIWQIENELNDAYLQAVARLRSPSNLIPERTPWGNFSYVTEVLQTLYMAVKDEDPSLWTTQNVVADVPKEAYELGRFPEYYLNAVQVWDPIMDMVSFDMYPNYFQANPVYSSVLANVTLQIRSVLTNASKPIMVAETGSHVMNAASLANVTLSQMNQTFQAQANYLAQSFLDTFNAGVSGFQVFKLAENSGYNNPPGGYTRQDVNFLQACTDAVVENSLQPLFDWITSLSSIRYILDGRAVEVASAPTTTSFGILDGEGNLTTSFKTLQYLYSNVPA